MKTDKVIYGLIIAGVVGGGAYYVWTKREQIKEKFKDWFPKNVNIDPEDVITYEELQARRAIHKSELESVHRATQMEMVGEVTPDDLLFDDDWFELNNRWVRYPNEVERVMGYDYDPTIEEIVELYDEDGELQTYIAKIGDISDLLRNASEERSVNDVIESVEDFADSIHLLKKGGNDIMDLRATYGPDTTDRLDYFYAMLMDTSGIEDMNLRRKLINLFTWDYVPNQYDISSTNAYEILQNKRVEFFGYNSVNTTRVSVGELILYYAERYLSDVGEDRYSAEAYVAFMLNNIPLFLDGSEHDAIIHDTLISYLEHGRSLHPNASGGFGLFGLEEVDYENVTNLEGEYQRSMGYLVDNLSYKLPLGDSY